MQKSFWATITKKQRDKPHWLTIAAKHGIDAKDPNAPVYFDQVPKRGAVTLDAFPELQTAIRALRRGETLVVGNLGHFVTNAAWHWVAEKIADKAALVECDKTGAVLDGSDIGAGEKLLKAERARTANEKRIAAGIPAGRPKPKNWHISYAEAVRRYGDIEISIPAIAGAAGVSVMTVRRKIKELTGTDNKSIAVTLAKTGGWPPKRKLKV